jgi:16S rRNA (guanine527-N7)-methyltransferase
MKNNEMLMKGLKKLDISCSEEQIAAFMTCLTELKKWNKAYNLTSLKTDEDIIIKHFLDSLLYLEGLPHGKVILADIGSGAGFPGIPIKIIRPEVDMTLVESSRKKAAFLRNIVRLLQLEGIHILEQRIEALGTEYEKKYDVILSRATFNIKDFLDHACPYLNKRGILLLSKGPKVSEEVKAIEESVYSQDAVREVLTVQLPFTEARRNLVVLSCKMKK